MPLDVSALDEGIRNEVLILREYGIETYESCQGGAGHAYPRPTVRFFGKRGEGYRAVAACFERGLTPYVLNRVWPLIEGELTGPYWEIVFRHKGAGE